LPSDAAPFEELSLSELVAQTISPPATPPMTAATAMPMSVGR
jgi:hypothetical protein